MIPVPDDETFAKIEKLANEIYYSPDACEADNLVRSMLHQGACGAEVAVGLIRTPPP